MRAPCLALAAASLAGLVSAVPAQASEGPGVGAASVGAPAMSNAELAQNYGGFETPGGFQITVGYSLQTSIDGEIVSASGSLPSQALPAAAQAPVAQFVQSARAGATVTEAYVDAVAGSASSVVRNSLNNAVIKNFAQLNVSIANYSQIQSTVGTLTSVSRLTAAGLVNGLH